MIAHPAFTVEPWAIRETDLDLDVLAQTESVFALANGHIGLRANLDEGEPHSIPGTYLNSFYELRPLPYAETAYGYPESSQSLVNVTNGKIIRLHFPYFEIYRKQVVKQPDLVLALHVRGDAFTSEEKARDFDYYEPLTVRDSSLSASTQAVMAAEVGHLELAYDYFGEAALMDLEDLEHNVCDGVHIASVAGTWTVAVAGFGGMRDYDGHLTFAPCLPARLTRLACRPGSPALPFASSSEEGA